nr:ribonuclease H-like domain-containing protein [Tanacetum cinerariifolium]
MVTYLEMSEGSKGFHHIIDFLSASHIKYALTENPTIYASLIEQFWQTSALSIIKDGVMAITTTINRNVKVLITEASIRRHLKLGDSEEETTPMPHDLPLQSVHSLRRDKGSLSLNELTVLCTYLSTKVQSLENELQQAKKVYSSTFTKLILRVKKLERTVKTSKARRKARIVISEDEDAEDPSKQWRSLIEELIDVDISLVPPHAADQGRKSDDTRIVDGVVHAVAPTTTEQILVKKNYMKARGTLLMALPDKHQLKFTIHKDSKSLMEAIEKGFGGNKETKKIYEAEVKSSSSTSHSTQNIAFVSSQNTDNTNESVSAILSVSAASTKPPASILPNVDYLSDAVGCYNCHRRGYFSREYRSPRDTRNKDTQRRTVLVETSTSNALVSQCDGLESVEARLVVYQENQNVFEEDIKLLKLDVMLRENALVELRKKFEKAEKERYELKHTLEKILTSLKNLSKLLESQITDKTSLGYDNQVFNSIMFDYNELNSSEIDESVPTSPVHNKYKSGEGYHAVPPLYTGTFMPPKPDLVFHDATTVTETVSNVFNVEPSTTKPTQELSQLNRPFAPIIKDWVSDSKDESEGEPIPTKKEPGFVQTTKHVKTSRSSVKPDCDYYEKKMVQKPVRNHAIRGTHQHSANMTHPHTNRHVVPTAILTRSRLVPLNVARSVTTTVPETTVTRPRPVQQGVNKTHSPIRRPINHRTTPKHRNFHKPVTTVKVNQGNPQQPLEDKDVIDSGCSRHMTRNISYLSEFKEINGGYVAFGGNPKGGQITGKGKIRTSKLDFDDVYFVKELKFNLFSISQMCDKKNNVLFTDTECVVLSYDLKLPDENHVLLRVPTENNMYNVDLKNIVPSKDLTFLFVKATLDETPSIGFMRPFGCPVSIFNTLDSLGKFKGKADEGFLVGYFVSRSGPTCLFDIDTLTQSMNYQQVATGNQLNHNAGIQENFDAGKVGKVTESAQQYVLLPLWSTGSKDPQNTDVDVAFDVKEPGSEVAVSLSSSDKPKKHDEKTNREAKGKSHVDLSTRVRNLSDEFKDFSSNSTNRVNAASALVTAIGPNSTNNTNSFNAAGPSDNAVSPNFEIGGKSSFLDPSQYPDDPNMPLLKDIIYSDDAEDVGAEADFSN